MKREIDGLLKVQERDVRIYSLEKEKEYLPQELSAFKAKAQELENKVKAKQEENKKLQVTRKDLEVELEAKQENIKKCEVQLYQLKTNEEYKTMQKQINDQRFECGILEDKILEKMEGIDEANAELKELENISAGAKYNLVEKEKEISHRIEIINDDIKKEQEGRDVLAKEVSPDFLKKYELIFNNKQGAALVSIENKACQGCHMALPPNVINEVKRGSKLIICDNCARILYYPNNQG